MLAPEPFFEPRGTPFSEYHRLKALSELGHQVDLVTYPIGRDVEIPNLRIFRALAAAVRQPGPHRPVVHEDRPRRPDAVHHPGAACSRERYDAIHSHEEMGLVGVWLAKWLRIPHLYDMHSSLPQQLSNFKYSRSGALRKVFTWAEEKMVHGSQSVITICQELQDTVVEMGAGDRSLLIENVMGGDVDEAPSKPTSDDPDGVGHCAGRAAGALHRHVRGLSGRGHADRRRRHPGEVAAAGAHPGGGRRAAAGGPCPGARSRAGRRRRDGLHRPAARARDPELRAGVRRAGVAAHLAARTRRSRSTPISDRAGRSWPRTSSRTRRC